MITKFKLFESRMSDQEIHRICKEYSIRNYIINPDGSISVDGDVSLSSRFLKRIPLVFKEVSGNFNCYDNQLTSLEGCPEKVGGSFDCSHNNITSLEGCPEKVGGDFDCGYNQLTSLEGCPEKVGGYFYCFHNQLTSLEGCPEKVGGGFNCSSNKLTTLKGCPGIVGGNFDCHYNQLTSLEGCPEKVGGYFYCFHNQLTSLEGCPDVRNIHCLNNKITSFEGIPEFWEGKLNIFSNPVDEIFKLFNRDVRCIDLINEFDVIQGSEVSRDRLEEVFSQLNMEIPKNIKLKEYILT